MHLFTCCCLDGKYFEYFLYLAKIIKSLKAMTIVLYLFIWNKDKASYYEVDLYGSDRCVVKNLVYLWNIIERDNSFWYILFRNN